MSITADLSRIKDAFVVPATTAFTYRARGMTVQQVAKDAAVRFVLSGSVLASGQDVRVTSQLMDSKTGAHKGDRQSASRYVAEYQKRATAQGFKGIESNAPSPGTPPAFLKYYYSQFLPEWKKAGLP